MLTLQFGPRSFAAMRMLLAFLLSFLLVHTQAQALVGGPDYSRGQSGNINVVGTYAGVLLPETAETEEEAAEPDAEPDADTAVSSSVGIFSVTVPSAGFATGAILIFVEGTSFIGTMTGVADPSDGTLDAVIDAISTYQVVDPRNPEANFRVFCQGNLEAAITLTESTFTQNFRLIGTASVDIFGRLQSDNTPDVTTTARYVVDGFKQSQEVVSSSIDFGGGG